MKIKTGFTTNSSSSSFVILSKKPLKTEKDFETLFKEIMGENKLFSNLSSEIGNSFYRNATEMTIKEFLEDRCYEDLSEADDVISENISEYPLFYEGSFGDDAGDVLESFLCNADINYKDDNIIISKDGGY